MTEPSPIARRLLVGVTMDTDGEIGAGSRRATDAALHLAERTGATITFMHSTFADHDPAEGPHAWDELDGARTRALARLVSEAHERGVGARASTVSERPWLDVLRRADRGEVDFVIVGKRDRSRADTPDLERRLGTTSVALLQQCPVPVLLVHPEAPDVPRCVLAATDLTPVGASAVRLGAALARTFDAELHVVHAWQQTMQLTLAHTDEARHEEERRIDEHARSQIRRELDGAAAELHVGCTSPERAILTCVERLSPDVVVMGSVSRTGVPGLLVGNTAERMRTRLDTSLLVLKPEGFAPPALR